MDAIVYPFEIDHHLNALLGGCFLRIRLAGRGCFFGIGLALLGLLTPGTRDFRIFSTRLFQRPLPAALLIIFRGARRRKGPRFPWYRGRR